MNDLHNPTGRTAAALVLGMLRGDDDYCNALVDLVEPDDRVDLIANLTGIAAVFLTGYMEALGYSDGNTHAVKYMEHVVATLAADTEKGNNE